MPGTLYLVSTPIGNLKDMTFRAVDILRSVDVIACEDTRHTRKLLNHFEISNKLVSYHEHNEVERARELGSLLASGGSVAVVSDAGTPGISDPSYRIVQMALEIGVAVVPVPGPTAFVSAIVASGLATDAIYFGGFLPSKKNERRKRLGEIAGVPATAIFYESPRRIESALTDCLEVLGDRLAVVARELTKLHEEFFRGRLSELNTLLSHATLKGEIVLLIERGHPKTSSVSDTLTPAERIKELVASGMERKAALKVVAKEFGMTRAEAYRRTQVEKR